MVAESPDSHRLQNVLYRMPVLHSGHNHEIPRSRASPTQWRFAIIAAMRTPHFALVVPHFDPARGGREAWVAGFAQRLAQDGFRVTVVCQRAANAPPDVQLCYYKWSAIPQARANSVARVLATVGADAVYDVGEGPAADVLHLHTGSEVSSEMLSVRAGPWPTRLRVAIVPTTQLRWAMARRLEAKQLARARRVVAVSGLAARQLQATARVPLGDRIKVVPNGIDVSAFRAPPPSDVYRTVLKSDGRLLLLAVGHNHYLKGFDAAVEAVAICIAAGHAVRLVIAGGSIEGPLSKMIARRHLSDHVTLLGVVKDMAPLYAAADILVHPTRWDACGLVVLEAMAAGRPVIVSKMAGAAERVVQGETGLLLEPPAAPLQVVREVERLSDPKVRERIGHAAQQAAGGFDITRNHDAIIEMLVAAAEGNRSGQ